MEILQSFIIFLNNILNLKIFDNITILEILIYVLFVSAVITIIKIATKGSKK